LTTEYTKEQKEENYRLFGLKLKHLRQISHLTQQELADAIGLNNASMIAAIESGARPIPAQYLRSYARHLNIEIPILARMFLDYRLPELSDALFEDQSPDGTGDSQD